MPGMHGVPAPLRSGIDIHLERDIAAVHRTMGPSPAGSRPTPLYMKQSKFSVPARKRSPAKTEFLGPSQAMRSRDNFKNNGFYITTQRDEDQRAAMSSEQRVAITKSSLAASAKAKTTSLMSDVFFTKSSGDLRPSRLTRPEDNQPSYTTTQQADALTDKLTNSQMAALTRSSLATRIENKSDMLTSDVFHRKPPPPGHKPEGLW